MPEAVPLANPPNPFGSIHSSVEYAKSFIVVNVATQARESGGQGQAGRSRVNLQLRIRTESAHPLRQKVRVSFIELIGSTVEVHDIQLASISLLKLCRYRSTLRETAPPKLEVSLKVTHVVRPEHDSKETTPAARWSGA